MKTLNDIVQAINEVPLKEFDDYRFEKVITLIRQKQNEWSDSEEYTQQLEKENKKLDRRQERRAELASRRYTLARKLVKPGMFIKMEGTRDSHGIRRVVSITSNEIVCRQWLKTYVPQIQGWKQPLETSGIVFFTVRHPRTRKDVKMPFKEIAQMTTHGYEKVVGVFDDNKVLVKLV